MHALPLTAGTIAARLAVVAVVLYQGALSFHGSPDSASRRPRETPSRAGVDTTGQSPDARPATARRGIRRVVAPESVTRGFAHRWRALSSRRGFDSANGARPACDLSSGRPRFGKSRDSRLPIVFAGGGGQSIGDARKFRCECRIILSSSVVRQPSSRAFSKGPAVGEQATRPAAKSCPVCRRETGALPKARQIAAERQAENRCSFSAGMTLRWRLQIASNDPSADPG